MTDKTTNRQRHIWLTVLILLGIVGLLVWRWPHGSLWYDEALTTYVATNSWQTLLRWCTQVDIQVPFHYIVLRFWTVLVGDSEFTLRLLSALCTLLAIAATLAIGQRLARRSGLGYATAIMLGASPGLFWIGYEVRAYALGFALFAWATFFFVLLLDPKRINRRWLIIIYSLLMLAALYTHYTVISGFIAHLSILVIIALVRRSKALFITLIAIMLLIGIGFTPWLPILLTRSSADRSYYSNGHILPDQTLAVTLGFKLLSREDAPSVAVPLIVGYLVLMALGILIGLIWQRPRLRVTVLAGLMLAIWPILITAVLVYFKPKLAGRYLWPAWIGFDLLAGLVIVAIVRWQRVIGVAVLALLIVIPWQTGAIGHPPDSDFRAAFAYICTHGTPQDVIALRDGTLFVANEYYGHRAPCDQARATISLPPAEITNVDQPLDLETTRAAMQQIITHQPPNVWIVAWQGDVMDPQSLAYGLLDGNSPYTVIDKLFGDVRVDRYETPQPFMGDPTTLGTHFGITAVVNGPTLQSARIITPPVVHTGDTVVLDTWWTRGAVLQPDLHVVAQITSPDGGWTYFSIDQPPSGWKNLDDRWPSNVPILGRYELPIGSDIPAGKVLIRYLIRDTQNRWPQIILKIGEITVAG